MAKKDPQVERLSDVLENTLKRLELTKRLDEYGVWPVWNDVVGEPIARNAQPEKIRHGTLFVRVASPVWMQQLQYMKEMIAEKLNQRLKGDIVKNIFFVVGRVGSETMEAESKTPPPKLSESPEEAIDEEFLESVKDPQIKLAFKKLLQSSARRKKAIDG